MNVWKISVKNFKHKPLYTFLAILILSISIALFLVIKQLDTSLKTQFNNNLAGIDLVIGAKGSPLQLVLASVMHIDNPTGNISYNDAKRIAENPMVKLAAPISYGDNYKGYRIVGTTKDFISFYNANLKEGKLMIRPMEVVLGATVANRLGLQIGDTFLSSHGLADNESDVHDTPLVVVGIFNSTHKVIDQLILTPLETVWEVHDHEEEHDDKEDEQEITSLLVSFKNPMALLTIPRTINENTTLQAALPKYELERLYQFTGLGVKTLTYIAYIILIISCITIFTSLYKMVREHAYDLALMRTYGASTGQLIKILIYEGFLIIGLSLITGFLFAKAVLYFMLEIINKNYGQRLPISIWNKDILFFIALVAFMVFFSIAMAIHPILKMNISKIISHEK